MGTADSGVLAAAPEKGCGFCYILLRKLLKSAAVFGQSVQKNAVFVLTNRRPYAIIKPINERGGPISARQTKGGLCYGTVF